MSPRLSSLPFLLGEEQYRQPRAVYKYWARMKFFHSFVPGSHLGIGLALGKPSRADDEERT